MKMVVKLMRTLAVPCRNYSKWHHTVLPADIFEGITIPKTKTIPKEDQRQRVKYGGRYIVTMLPGEESFG